MDVLLLQDVDQLGLAGDIRRVADGYARNYLIPRQLAVVASPGATRQAQLQRQASTRRQAKELSEAQALAQLLDERTVTFQARAGESDRLYGSITSANIAEALEEKADQEVDRRKIELDEPLKELGTHAVTVRLAAEAEAKVTVIIERLGDEPEAVEETAEEETEEEAIAEEEAEEEAAEEEEVAEEKAEATEEEV